MQQGNFTSINWSGNTMFYGYKQGDLIYDINGNKIGVSVEKHQEVEDGLKKCKDKLIELGIIKVPKTQDDIIKEQNDMLQQQQEMIKNLIEKYEGLTNEPRTTKENSEHVAKRTTSESELCVGEGIISCKPSPDKNTTTSKRSSK